MGNMIDERLRAELTRHVLAFVPTAAGEELEHRIALVRARDFAAWHLGRRIEQVAYDLAKEAHEFAGAFVYAEVSPAQLDLAVKLCRCLVQAAFLVDHLSEEAGDEG